MSFDHNDLDHLEALKAHIVAEVAAALDRRLYAVEQRVIAVNDNICNWLDRIEPRLHIGPDMEGLS